MEKTEKNMEKQEAAEAKDTKQPDLEKTEILCQQRVKLAEI